MTTTASQSSPFLDGLLAPVHDERDDHNLRVTGELPAGLRGTFVRNGPNPQFAPMAAYHPFDGDGMLHAVTIDDGEVRYRNRWIESKGLRAERARGRSLYGGMTEFVMPEPDVVAEGGFRKNVANTHTVRHAGRILALFEAGLPTELTADLATIGEWDFDGRLVGACTAHPKVDPTSGELIFFGYNAAPPYLRYHVASADGTLVHSTAIDLPRPVMIHDFVATEHWTIFFDSPAVFDREALTTGGPLIRWQPEHGTRIGVLPRFGDGSQIRWFDVDNQYVVHTFNGWEHGSTIEISAPRFSEMLAAFASTTVSESHKPLPWRWSIDLEAGTVRDEQIDDRPGDFPRVNDDHATRPTRYLYNNFARSWAGLDFDFNGVIKYDLDTGGTTEHFYSDSEVSGEHVFVPDPDRSAEDAGWLLSLVVDRAGDQTDLVVLDAQDVAGPPVARIHLPRRVPLGFHANWFPAVG